MKFTKKEDIIQIREMLWQSVYNTLKGVPDQPNAQEKKFAKEMIEDAGLDMIDKKKGNSGILTIIKPGDKEEEEDLMEAIKNT